MVFSEKPRRVLQDVFYTSGDETHLDFIGKNRTSSGPEVGRLYGVSGRSKEQCYVWFQVDERGCVLDQR